MSVGEPQELSPDEFRQMVNEVALPLLRDHHVYVAGSGGGPDLLLNRAFGLRVWDAYGGQFLDMTAGGGPLVLGHCHDAGVVGPHAQLSVYSTSARVGQHVWPRQVELAKALSGRFPPAADGLPKKVLFTSSGREALQVASAIAGGRHPINPLADGEPSPAWAAEEADRARAKGLPVVVDETRTAYGRMGAFLAQERLGVQADVTLLGETGGAGFPFGAVVADERWLAGVEVPPFACGPVVAVAALGVLERMTPELFKRAAELGDALHRALRSVADQFAGLVSGVRGWGTVRKLVLARPHAVMLRDACLARGLLVEVLSDSEVGFSPALTAGPMDVALAADVLTDAFLEWPA